MNDYERQYRYLVGVNLERRTESFIALDRIQGEIIEWQNRNFGIGPTVHPLLGMVEEIGELAHAVLKSEQGIRGTAAEHEAAAKDSIGDLSVYMMAYCAKRGWHLSDIIEETWLHVQKRDWTRNKADGGDVPYVTQPEDLPENVR